MVGIMPQRACERLRSMHCRGAGDWLPADVAQSAQYQRPSCCVQAARAWDTRARELRGKAAASRWFGMIVTSTCPSAPQSAVCSGALVLTRHWALQLFCPRTLRALQQPCQST